jgi:pyruvate formate lyase activating enzyme
MVFGGIQKHSLIDYPGKLSCVLFTSGCNFNCPYCHNPELATGRLAHPLSLQEKNIYEFLSVRKGFLDGVVISGGEPTLHEDLDSLCGNIRSMGYKIKLDTNGSRPKKLQYLLDQGCIDYVAMDIKTDPFAYCPLIARNCKPETILASIKIIMEAGIPYEFRTTCVPSLVTPRVVERISKLIQGAPLYALQHFQNERVLQPEFFETHSPQASAADLSHYQSIASQWVRTCIIR